MLGEFGEQLPEAPYLLETFVDTIEEQESLAVRRSLLTAAVKLFIKRPPECQRMLGRLLAYEINEETNMDVRDRAMFYYRLLRSGAEHVRRVVLPSAATVDRFTDDDAVPEQKDRLFEEFNSLAVVYGQPPELFVTQTAPYALGKSVPAMAATGTATPADAAASDAAVRRTAGATDADASGTAMAAAAAVGDLLGGALIGDVDEDTGGTGDTAAATATDLMRVFGADAGSGPAHGAGAGAAAAPAPSLSLVPEPLLQPSEFERQWLDAHAATYVAYRRAARPRRRRVVRDRRSARTGQRNAWRWPSCRRWRCWRGRCGAHRSPCWPRSRRTV